MTDEEKVGQLFLAHCPASGAEDTIKRLHLGGLVLFAKDFESDTPQSALEKSRSYQSAADIPLFISADEEGGTVVRISKFPQYRAEPFKAPKEIFSSGGWEAVKAETAEKSRLLLSVGVNLDLAPVCDYTLDEEKYIARRSFGVSPEACAEFIKTTVETMNSEGLASCLKHFPGYGGNSDTHKGMSEDVRPLEAFEREDLLPFIAGIKAGCPFVMVSHNIVSAFDPAYPSSLSIPIHAYLREKLGFEGVIITDSLTMGAIREFTGGGDPCVRALTCGNDMIISAKFEEGYESILKAVKDKTVPAAVLDAAVDRILSAKDKYIRKLK